VPRIASDWRSRKPCHPACQGAEKLGFRMQTAVS